MNMQHIGKINCFFLPMNQKPKALYSTHTSQNQYKIENRSWNRACLWNRVPCSEAKLGGNMILIFKKTKFSIVVYNIALCTRYYSLSRPNNHFLIPLFTNKLQPHSPRKCVLLWKSYTVPQQTVQNRWPERSHPIPTHI